MIESVLDRLISENVISPDISQQIQEAFETRVLAETEKRLVEKQEELEESFKIRESQLMSYADEWSENIMSLSEEWADKFSAELENKVDEYLTLTVEQWIKENSNNIENLVESKKVEALAEGFKALLVTGAVTLDEIQENIDSNNASATEELDRMSEEVDRLASQAISYKKERDSLLQEKLINEACDGLTYTQSEKLKELAEGISFDSDRTDNFEKQLDYIKSTIFSQVSTQRAGASVPRKETSKSILSSARHLY